MQLPLDHNFPEPIVNALKPWMGSLELLPIRQIDDRLTELDDRPLLIALRQLGFEGLVTLNYRMLRNPSELAAVIKTGLTVFAIEGVGHDPLRATGALLLDLPSAVNAVDAGATGVFWMRPRAPQPQDPRDLFDEAATRRHEDPDALYASVEVSDAELQTPVLAAS